MSIDLEKKSNELKDFVSQFESSSFLGELSILIHFISSSTPISSLTGLSSPQRQLIYLAGLNVASRIERPTLKGKFSDGELTQMKILLNEIEEGYNQFFYPKPGEMKDQEWQDRRRIAMPYFLSYFNQGDLNYPEQIIERVSEYFTPFDSEIISKFGISTAEFIDFYKYLFDVPNTFFNDQIFNKSDEKSWEESIKSIPFGQISPEQAFSYLPQSDQNLFNWLQDPGKLNQFKVSDLIQKFGKQKAETFLTHLTVERIETRFLYYTEKNILFYKPIFKIDNDTFQILELKLIIQSIYNLLLDFCIQQPKLKERFYETRGKKLEDKIEKLFINFYDEKCFIYKEYFTQDNKGQDLLIISKGLALIIEAKSSKRDEPRRDPVMAYPLILSNFEETIQKGYDQTYRVKSKFINKQVLNIYKDQDFKNNIINIKTKNYYNVFSIIVTLERFGHFQTDLNLMLELYEDDEYPISICIDDLECILLMIKKIGNKKQNLLTDYLRLREIMHGRTISSDELEISGAFLQGKISYKNFNENDVYFIGHPDLADIFDHTYKKTGLGFMNELNLEQKLSDEYLPFGGI